MKTLLALTISMTFSTTLFASEVSKACYSKAMIAAISAVDVEYYDQGGFYTTACKSSSSNKNSVVCEVVASKGDGAATDTFSVVLNKDCTKALKIELTGEE